MEKPKNLIIISIDDLRSDCIAANPKKELLKRYKLKTKLETPILDWFVKNGVFFDNCITTAPYTTTAHASILTGHWPYRHGIQEYFEKLKSPTILRLLKNEGFATLFQTDFPTLLGDYLGFTKGADKFVKLKDQENFQWLAKHRRERVACFFHFGNVHHPFGFQSLETDGVHFIKKVLFLKQKYRIKESDIKGHLQDPSKGFSKAETVLRANYSVALAKMHKLGLYGEIMDLYAEGINYFEKGRFKSFMASLRKLGLLENSLIVIVGDHGEMRDEKTRSRMVGSLTENTLSDEVIKVPLIFYGQGLSRGKVLSKQVRTIDVVPTALSLLGITAKASDFDGHDLSSFKNIPKNLPAFSQYWLTDRRVFDLRSNESGRKKLAKLKLNHYLNKASLRLDGWKVVQDYSEKGKVIKTRYFDVRKSEKECSSKNRIFKVLEKKLRDFNRLSGKVNSRISKTPRNRKKEIASQLRSLGYNV